MNVQEGGGVNLGGTQQIDGTTEAGLQMSSIEGKEEMGKRSKSEVFFEDNAEDFGCVFISLARAVFIL